MNLPMGLPNKFARKGWTLWEMYLWTTTEFLDKSPHYFFRRMFVYPSQLLLLGKPCNIFPEYLCWAGLDRLAGWTWPTRPFWNPGAWKCLWQFVGIEPFSKCHYVKVICRGRRIASLHLFWILSIMRIKLTVKFLFVIIWIFFFVTRFYLHFCRLSEWSNTVHHYLTLAYSSCCLPFAFLFSVFKVCFEKWISIFCQHQFFFSLFFWSHFIGMRAFGCVGSLDLCDICLTLNILLCSVGIKMRYASMRWKE